MDSISEIIKDQSEDIPVPDKNQLANKNSVKEDKKRTVEGIKVQNKNKPQETKQKSTDSKKEESQLVPLVKKISQQLDTVISLLNNQKVNNSSNSVVIEELEGVFDGKEMISSDASRFKVPVDFINKNKLVEGDLLKLKVKEDKSYKYEQVGSVNRKRIVGTLTFNNATEQWKVKTEKEEFKIVNETVNLHDGEKNNKVVVLIPKNGKSSWATIENVFK